MLGGKLLRLPDTTGVLFPEAQGGRISNLQLLHRLQVRCKSPFAKSLP